MNERRPKSETLRIDLIPGAEPDESPAPADAILPTPPKFQARKPKEPDIPTTVSRSRYQELLQSIYDAAIVTNVFGKITDANSRATEFLRYDREELCTLQVFDVIAGADRSLINTLCTALQNERFTLLQAYCRRRDGSFFPAEIAVNMLKFGQVYLCFFIRDITRRKQIEDRLRTEHEAIHNAATGVVIADLEARIEYGNPAFGALVNFADSDDLIGEDLHGFVHPQDTIEKVLREAVEAEGVWRGPVSLRGSGSAVRQVEMGATCSRDSEGEPVNLVFSFADRAAPAVNDADVTQRQQDLEDARRQIADLTAELTRLRAATPPAPGG